MFGESFLKKKRVSANERAGAPDADGFEAGDAVAKPERARAEQPAAPVRPHVAGSDELDLPGIWNAIVRRKKTIGGVTLACFLGALAFVTVTKSSYTGDARVLIENQESYFTQPKGEAGGGAAPDAETVASQEQLVNSRDLARAAIKELGLKGNPEFDPLASGQGFVSRLLLGLGLKTGLANLAPEDRILENFSKRLTAFTVPKSRVLTIQFSAQDPQLAARGANKIADLYIEIKQKAKKESAAVAAVSLGNLIADLRKKLAEAEGKVESFRAQSGLQVGANNALLPSQALAEINTQLATARNAMAEAQAKAKLIRETLRQGRLGEVSDVAKDEVVRRLAIQRSTLRSQLALESRTLGPAHPRIKELRAQLSSVESELGNAANKAAHALENDARIASNRVENLQAAISSQQEKVGSTSVDQVKLREYELEAKLIREQLENNLNKYREALARQHSLSTPGDARIISRAFEPQRPSFPKKLPILIFATLAGLVLSLAWVVAGELLSGRAFVPAAPGYAGVPGLPRDLSGIPAGIPAGYVLQQPQIVAAAAPPPKPPKPELTPVQKRLLEKLSGMDTLGYGRRILVCPESAAADHAVAIEPLARELSATRSAILVDLSGRLQTGLAGLTELLQGLSSFGDVIERDEGSRLHVIPRGWSDLDVGPDLDVILDALSQTYDFVFIIAPEERHHTVALELAPAADLALIGAAAAISGEKAVALRMQLLEHGAGDVAVWPAPRMEDADARAPEAA